MNKIFENIWLVLAVVLISASPAMAMAQSSAPEPISTTLFLVGGAALIAGKKFHKK